MRLILGALFLVGSLQSFAQQVEKPTIKSKTTFAIVVDDKTYKAAETELKAYRQVVEKDGLGTYIITDNWTSPEKIRETLHKLYLDKSSPLEGVVLVGNIPVPMIRDAQYLTSAFKMNQRFRWDSSSVPSDRYYDDFDLQFDYLKQDTAKGRESYHYYSLKAESPQFIDMDIYSARIKPPVVDGEDMTLKIKTYLSKIVKLRSQSFPLDDMIVSVGHGYNSNSVNSVMGEAIALKTQFPNLFQPGGSIKFLNFRSAEFIKFNLLSELKRDGIDFAYMTGHGTARMQLLSGYPNVSSPQPSMQNVARYIRSKMRAAKEDGRDLEVVKEGFQKSLGLSDKWFEDSFDQASIEADSIYNINMDVQMSDIKNANIQAKLVYLNSCLTGSFHLDNYIAGYYPFSDNQNIAAVANSIGVLQDLYPSELMGLLGQGYRVGNWLKHIAYLETHILGDPTFYFASNRAKELNEATVLNKKSSYWKSLLKENDASLQALALDKLTQLLSEKEVSPILKSYYFNSAFESTRMQAFQLLSQFENQDYIDVLHAAKNDSYEYIRRRAIYDLTDFGSNEFVKDLIQFYVSDPHSERVAYRIRWALQFMDPTEAKRQINEVIRQNNSLFGGKDLADKLDKDVEYYQKKTEELNQNLTDKSVVEKERLSAINSLRLYRNHNVIPNVIKLAKDNSESEALRVAGLEAMGWFTLSYQRDEIVKACDDILKSQSSEAIKKEALKTKNRIKGNSHKI
ncbi:HEAT repeat domain-containing protein [Sphingobacterium composti Ten et al. 2007 non Yoo et al. 2007]|uniref:HEAT repeat domain-containing protein n=1 Tax=Sphingobacterium composti TaxID=363260 RepID=UPI001F2BBB1C|nr:HEAT repeat domain-containing protein [Sphingobacterium composti Ten et al. 2007 non Yoo et al. 2007]